MLDFECPHCKRHLRIPEEYMGAAGSCKHCGGRFIVPQVRSSEDPGEAPSSVPPEAVEDGGASPAEGSPVLSGIELDRVRNLLSQSDREVQRLKNDLENERLARLDAESSLQAAETCVRLRQLDEKLAEDFARARAAKAEAEVALQAAEERLAEMEEELSRATERTDELEGDLAREQTSRERAETLNEELEGRLERADGEKADLEAERDARVSELEETVSAERKKRAEAQAELEVAEARARRLEEKLTAATTDDDPDQLRLELDRTSAQLTRARADVQRLAEEVEAARTELVRAEAARKAADVQARRFRDQLIDVLERADVVTEEVEETVIDDGQMELGMLDSLKAERDADGGAKPSAKARRKRGITLTLNKPWAYAAGVAVCLFVLVAGIGLLPWAEPLRAGIGSALGLTEEPVEEPAPVVEIPTTGSLAATVRFTLPAEGEDEAPEPIPAAGAPMVLARVGTDEAALLELLTEAEVAEDVRPSLVEWYFDADSADPEAKRFESAEGLTETPLDQARAKMAEYAEGLGREAFDEKLRAAAPLAPPDEWMEHEASAEGMLQVDGLEPGPYWVGLRPAGPPETWHGVNPLPGDPDVFAIAVGETARGELESVDTLSAIHGTAVDPASGKAISKAKIVVSGDAVGEKDLKLTTDEDGAFAVGPHECGYGEFAVHCDPLPKGYVEATSYHGVREAGVVQTPIIVQVSKETKTASSAPPTVSGRVLNPNGTPAQGFTVWVVQKDGSARAVARSNRDGAYSFEHKGGTLTLYAAGQGTARTEPFTLDLQPKEQATRDFILPKTGRIVLHVATAEGKIPESFEECSLVSESSVMSDPTMLQRVDDYFVIPHLTAGAYEVSFEVKGFKPVHLPGITISGGGEDKEFQVKLEPAS